MNEDSVILVLMAILSGGTIGSILTFFNGRRQGKTSQLQASTSHMEVVTDTLAELNDRLKKEVKELQSANDEIRRELEAERRMRRELENRVEQLERESKAHG